MLGLTKCKTIGLCTLFVLPPFCLLADGPKIDHFSHSVALDGNQLVSVRCSASREPLLPNAPTRGRKRAFTANFTTLLLILLCQLSPRFNTQLVDYKSRINESARMRVETNGEFARCSETSKCIFMGINYYTHENTKLTSGVTLRQFSAPQQFDRGVEKISSGIRTLGRPQYSRRSSLVQD